MKLLSLSPRDRFDTDYSRLCALRERVSERRECGPFPEISR
jgi:hypothetical protein